MSMGSCFYNCDFITQQVFGLECVCGILNDGVVDFQAFCGHQVFCVGYNMTS